MLKSRCTNTLWIVLTMFQILKLLLTEGKKWGLHFIRNITARVIRRHTPSMAIGYVWAQTILVTGCPNMTLDDKC